MDIASTVQLNNGLQIPVVGLGTWRVNPDEVTRVVEDAIDIGYRHFDCAHVYKNEVEIGRALRKKISEGAVKREDLWVTSKLWNTYHRNDSVEVGLRKSLNDLGLDYLDLYLIHWPYAYKEGDTRLPKNENGVTIYSDVKYTETWSALELCVDKGLVKAIGLSNFNSEQIQDILHVARIKPVVCQIECHPYLNQLQLSRFAIEREILVTGYMPLGSPDNPWSKGDDTKLLNDDTIKTISMKYDKSPAQILIRYQIDRGHIVIPKTTKKPRLKSNIDVFNFHLSLDDIAIINSLDRNKRYCHFSWDKNHQYYPFNVPY